MSTPSRLALLEESPSSPHDRVSPAFKTIEDPGTQSSPALLDESPSSPQDRVSPYFINIEDPGTQSSPALLDESPSSPQDRVSQAFKTPSGPAPQNSIWTRPNNDVVLPSDNEELNALQNELSKCILLKRKPKSNPIMLLSTDDEGDKEYVLGASEAGSDTGSDSETSKQNKRKIKKKIR